MRITILALGSRGDVQPFIPLGQGLQAAGHKVRIATFEAFAPLVLNGGLDFHVLRGDAHALLNTAMSAGLLDGRSNAFRYIQAIRQSYASLSETLVEDLADEELHDTDLILNQLPAYLFGGDLAEYLDIPWAIVAVIPLARTRTSPMIGFPPQLAWLPGYNLLSYRIGELMVWSMFGKGVNRLREEFFDLDKKPWHGDFRKMTAQIVPWVNGFSSHVVQRPPDWGDHVHITGWWHPQNPVWQPSANLLRFLGHGEAPVFLGFGSIPVRDPEAITSILVQASQKAGVRAVIHAGWAGLGRELPEDFLAIDYAPYDWLFDRVSVIVHHGGSGTSGFAFRSGKPSLFVPFGFDQYYWGDRGYELGVSPAPLPFKELSVDALTERIDHALTDRSMNEHANQLGQKLRAEDGIASAVEIIEAIGNQSER